MEQLTYLEQQKTSKLGIAEFIERNPQIKTIKFVVAHPDDELGYTAGLVSELSKINALRSPEERMNMDFVIVTDGANGTKDRTRTDLVKTRQIESVLGLSVVTGRPLSENLQLSDSARAEYQLDENTRIKFLGQRDSNIDQAELETELLEEIYANGADMIATHSTKPWSKSPQLQNPLLAVQNHKDHTTTAMAVKNVLGRMEEAGIENIPIMLKHTWGEGDLSVKFDATTKRQSFAAHHSQYSQNRDEMDRIIDELNKDGEEYFENYEILKSGELSLQNSLLQRAGEILQQEIVEADRFLNQAFERTGIRRVATLQTAEFLINTQPWNNLGAEVLDLPIEESTFNQIEFERMIRQYKIDFLVIPPNLQEGTMGDIHRTVMFLSSVAHKEAGELEPQKVVGWAQMLHGRKGETLNEFDINIGVW